ncbi:MAG: Cdc6/Cdc18 family protein [Thermoplasmata archaeon]
MMPEVPEQLKNEDIEEFRKMLKNGSRIFKPGGREYFDDNYQPNKLHHRDTEISRITGVLRPCLEKETPSTIMIYGSSGTGKTAVINYIGNKFREIGVKEKVPIFFVYVNCSTMDTAYALFQHLGNQFADGDKSRIPSTGWPFQAVIDKLKENLSACERIVILALDEVDRLVKKSGDDALHTLLTLKTECPNAKIGFVGISNDLRLMENLEPRVKSRLAGENITFNPYTAEQLKTILLTRAQQGFLEGKWREEEIALCAAIAAKESGDARRAIRILRTAADMAEREGAERIMEEHIYDAKNAIEKDVIKETIRKLRDHEKLVLYGICNLQRQRENITTGSIYSVYSIYAKTIGLSELSPRSIREYLINMDDLGLISAYVQSWGRRGRTTLAQLNIPLNETIQILEEDPLVSDLRKKIKPMIYREKTLDEV